MRRRCCTVALVVLLLDASCASGPPGSCRLSPGAPAGFRHFCNSTHTAAACKLLNETCRWLPSGGSCSLKPGVPAPYGPICRKANTSAACGTLNVSCAWTATRPPACNVRPGEPPSYKSACATAASELACSALNITCTWAPPPPPLGPAPAPGPRPPEPTLVCNARPLDTSGASAAAEWAPDCARQDNPTACASIHYRKMDSPVFVCDWGPPQPPPPPGPPPPPIPPPPRRPTTPCKRAGGGPCLPPVPPAPPPVPPPAPNPNATCYRQYNSTVPFDNCNSSKRTEESCDEIIRDGAPCFWGVCDPPASVHPDCPPPPPRPPPPSAPLYHPVEWWYPRCTTDWNFSSQPFEPPHRNVTVVGNCTGFPINGGFTDIDGVCERFGSEQLYLSF